MEHWNGKRLEKGFTQNLINEFRKKLAAILVNSLYNEGLSLLGWALKGQEVVWASVLGLQNLI